MRQNQRRTSFSSKLWNTFSSFPIPRCSSSPCCTFDSIFSQSEVLSYESLNRRNIHSCGAAFGSMQGNLPQLVFVVMFDFGYDDHVLSKLRIERLLILFGCKKFFSACKWHIFLCTQINKQISDLSELTLSLPVVFNNERYSTKYPKARHALRKRFRLALAIPFLASQAFW